MVILAEFSREINRENGVVYSESKDFQIGSRSFRTVKEPPAR